MLGSLGDTAKSAMAWAEKNPRMVQAATGMLGPMFQSLAQEKAVKEQLTQQEAAQERARARLNDSIAPLAMPKYVPKRGG
jgi:uncharacterized heparinase superfamily protein